MSRSTRVKWILTWAVSKSTSKPRKHSPCLAKQPLPESKTAFKKSSARVYFSEFGSILEPFWFRSAPGQPKCHPGHAEKLPRDSRGPPRDPPGKAKAAQRPHRAAQETPKRRPGHPKVISLAAFGPQEPPKGLPKGSKTASETLSSEL